MNDNFPYVDVPKDAEPFVGIPDPGTRLYRKYGSDTESEAWFSAIMDVTGDRLVSPGGAGMFCPVSRAAVHKRVKEGKLTMFCFHLTNPLTRFFGVKTVNREIPYAYICVSELKAWKKELEARAIEKGVITQEELEGQRPDWEGDFMRWKSKWMKAQQKQKKGN